MPVEGDDDRAEALRSAAASRSGVMTRAVAGMDAVELADRHGRRAEIAGDVGRTAEKRDHAAAPGRRAVPGAATTGRGSAARAG